MSTMRSKSAFVSAWSAMMARVTARSASKAVNPFMRGHRHPGEGIARLDHQLQLFEGGYHAENSKSAC
jgi:hypothetical protein